MFCQNVTVIDQSTFPHTPSIALDIPEVLGGDCNFNKHHF